MTHIMLVISRGVCVRKYIIYILVGRLEKYD